MSGTGDNMKRHLTRAFGGLAKLSSRILGSGPEMAFAPGISAVGSASTAVGLATSQNNTPEDERQLRALITYNPATVVDDFKDKLREVGLWSDVPGQKSEIQKCCDVIDQHWGPETRRNGEPAVNHFYYCMSFGFERLTDSENAQRKPVIHPDNGRDTAERLNNFQTALICIGLHDGPEDKGDIFTPDFFKKTFDAKKVDVPLIIQTTEDLNRYSKHADPMPTEREYEAKLLSGHWLMPTAKCPDRTHNLQGWRGLNYSKTVEQHAQRLGKPVEQMTPGEVIAAKVEKLGDYVNAGHTIADITETRAKIEARNGDDFKADVLLRSAQLVRVAANPTWEEAAHEWGFDPHQKPRKMRARVPSPPNGGINRPRVTAGLTPAQPKPSAAA